MADGVHVLTTDALESMRVAFQRFVGELGELFGLAEREVLSTFAWINDLARQWSGEVRRRLDEMEAARAAYEACLRAADDFGVIACAGLGERVRQAELHYMEALVEQARVADYGQRLESANNAYMPTVEALRQHLDQELPKGLDLLRRSVDHLSTYSALQAMSAPITVPATPDAPSSPPVAAPAGSAATPSMPAPATPNVSAEARTEPEVRGNPERPELAPGPTAPSAVERGSGGYSGKERL